MIDEIDEVLLKTSTLHVTIFDKHLKEQIIECHVFIIFEIAPTKAHDDYVSKRRRVVFKYTKAFICIVMLVCN